MSRPPLVMPRLQIVNETIPEENELYDLAELFKVFHNGSSVI